MRLIPIEVVIVLKANQTRRQKLVGGVAMATATSAAADQRAMVVGSGTGCGDTCWAKAPPVSTGEGERSAGDRGLLRLPG